MSQTFRVSTICFKHHIPMKHMYIAGFRVPYCPICTKPKKGIIHPVSKLTTEAIRIKTEINKEYWTKGGVKITSRKPKPIRENELIKKRNDGFHGPEDRYKFSTNKIT